VLLELDLRSGLVVPNATTEVISSNLGGQVGSGVHEGVTRNGPNSKTKSGEGCVTHSAMDRGERERGEKREPKKDSGGREKRERRVGRERERGEIWNAPRSGFAGSKRLAFWSSSMLMSEEHYLK
jgi:hypothetical protein